MKRARERFWRLTRDRDVRELSDDDSAFLEGFRREHPEEAELETHEDCALAALRAAKLDLKPSDRFESVVLRKWRVRASRSTFSYWAPAVVGAMVAAMAVLLVLQALTRETGLEEAKVPGAEAKLDTWQGHFPELRTPSDRAMP